METALTSSSRTAAAVEAVRTKAGGRLLFVDNLRVFLTVLVVLHHLMITYGGSGSWFYSEGRQDEITAALASWFCSVNQAYFMGLFLLISAYFVPGAYDRKGASRFLKDRLLRLGIPLAVYSWVIDPLFAYWRVVLSQGWHTPFFSFYPRQYFGKYGPLLGAGPLWFIETLLLFSAGYALWRWLAGRRPAVKAAQRAADAPFPGNGSIVLLALVIGVAAFLVRTVFPVGWSFGPLNLQLPHFAQYMVLFCVGLVAYRRNWLLGLPEKTGRLWLGIGILLILSFVPMALALDAAKNEALFRGGWNVLALLYALWESLLGLSLCIGLIYLFRRRLNRQGRLAGYLSRNAYTAYLIHAPVITGIAYAIRDVTLYPLLKWVLVALVAMPVCFALGGLIRRLPYADRAL